MITHFFFSIVVGVLSGLAIYAARHKQAEHDRMFDGIVMTVCATFLTFLLLRLVMP